jgi:hypothetical protein
MKKVLMMSMVAFLGVANINATIAPVEIKTEAPEAAKLSIKIKNDTDEPQEVINAGSGGTYRLAKNVTTTIKMDEGDKLYTYVKGKKETLLLTATADMDGQLQLFSKL